MTNDSDDPNLSSISNLLSTELGVSSVIDKYDAQSSNYNTDAGPDLSSEFSIVGGKVVEKSTKETPLTNKSPVYGYKNNSNFSFSMASNILTFVAATIRTSVF